MSGGYPVHQHYTDEAQKAESFNCSNSNEMENLSSVSNNQSQPEDTNFDYLYASLLFDEINQDVVESEKITVESSDEEPCNNDVLHSSIPDGENSLKSVLDKKSASISDASTSKFNICRSDVWQGTKRAMQRKSFCPNNKMSVKFTDDIGISEGAVDLGGPRREYLTLVLDYLRNSHLFTGPANSKLLS